MRLLPVLSSGPHEQGVEIREEEIEMNVRTVTREVRDLQEEGLRERLGFLGEMGAAMRPQEDDKPVVLRGLKGGAHGPHVAKLVQVLR